MTPLERALAYLAKCPPSVSGQGGHNTAFHVVCTVVNGFALGESDAFAALQAWNSTCLPPWSDRELIHKITEAQRVTHDKPRGHMLTGSSGFQSATSTVRDSRIVAPKPTAKQPVKYEVKPTELPLEIDDGARTLLRTCFAPGEGIRIVNATLDEEGHEVPDGSGPTLSREEWLRKLDNVEGDPNCIWKSSDRTGIYIAINPLKIGGNRDSDVIDFRHALIEIDEKLSPEEQFGLYQAMRIPCAAIIFSGGKSVHAWVKINARDRRQYDERVALLHAHFEEAGLPLDTKNKNPSRLSRLPFCERFSNRQRLLAVNVGAESFTEWLKEKEHDALGPCLHFKELMDLDTDHDPSCVIGFREGKSLRYLCKGKAAWIIGPSGIGKSSLNVEFAIAWALGKPAFGITPAKPLKTLIIQGENDTFDLAEMVQGVARAHNLDFDHETMERVNSCVVFKTETTAVGEHFIERLHRLIDREKPDVVVADPLLSFAGIDVLKQDQCSKFLREWLQPVLEATGVVLIGIHHTGKPKNARETANWSILDYAYSGLGSSELVNWARAVMVLHPHGDGVFELKLAKRGSRAGATHPNGDWARDSVWIRHAMGHIRWEQIERPVESEPELEAKLSKVQALATQNLHEPLSQIPPEGESATALGKRLHLFSKKARKQLGLTKCRTELLDLLCESGKLAYDDKNDTYKKGPNA